MKKLLYIALLTALVSCGYEEEEMVYVIDDASPVVVKEAPPLQEGAVVHAMETHIVPGRLNTIFNDSNALQLNAAQEVGIDPVRNLRSAYRVKRQLVKVMTNDIYYIDSMKYAMPYLVPQAAKLLTDIATAFRDTVKARSEGKGDYRLRVNSVLRTEQTVAKLRKVNRASTEKSCHLYGTTFDISWTKFDCMEPSYQISLESLKNLLAEIVYKYREEGRCYAIFEHKRGCMHITVRNHANNTKK